MLPIDFATVADGIDTGLAGAVVHFVKETVIADADAPFAVTADEFLAAGRARLGRQCVNRFGDMGQDMGWEFRDFPLGAPFDGDSVAQSFPAR